MPFIDDLDFTLNMCLLESLEDKMPHLINQLISKKSRWPGKMIEDETTRNADATALITKLAEYDPTGKEKYIPFLVRQVALGALKPDLIDEDGPKIKEALATFASKGKQWPGEKDLMAYKDYRELLRHASQYEKAVEQSPEKTKKGAKEAEREARYKGTTLHVDMMVPMRRKWTGSDWEEAPEGYEGNFKIYEMTDPNAAALWGKGTQWCTSSSPYRDKSKLRHTSEEEIKKDWKKFFENNELNYPWSSYEEVEKDIEAAFAKKDGKVPNPHFPHAINMAKQYLSDGPLYLIYLDGHPYMQLDSTGKQLMSIEDVPLSKIGLPTAKALVKLITTVDIPEGLAKQIVRVINNSKKKK